MFRRSELLSFKLYNNPNTNLKNTKMGHWTQKQASAMAIPVLWPEPCRKWVRWTEEKKHSFFSFGSQRRRSHFSTPRPPSFSLLASFVSSHLLRDSLCTALQTRRLWIWSTGLSVQLTPSSRRDAWVLGNLTAPTERSQRAIRWTLGRGGESYVLRLFPWRTVKISTYSEPW